MNKNHDTIRRERKKWKKLRQTCLTPKVPTKNRDPWRILFVSIAAGIAVKTLGHDKVINKWCTKQKTWMVATGSAACIGYIVGSTKINSRSINQPQSQRDTMRTCSPHTEVPSNQETQTRKLLPALLTVLTTPSLCLPKVQLHAVPFATIC